MSNFKVIHRLTLNCKKEVKSTQNSQTVKKWCSLKLKGLGEKSCKIKGGSQEIAAIMFMWRINTIAAIFCLPPLILQLFSPKLFKAAPLFHSLTVFE